MRLVGYGSMALESFVAIMALIAATLLDPGVYFAINTGAGIVGATPEAAVHTITGWGFPVTVEQMRRSPHSMGEQTLFARTGGAPSLAVGMASIFGSTFGQGLLALWYHFAIMFEAVFILATLDAGTRVGRFMLQDVLGHVWTPLGRTSWYPSVLFASAPWLPRWGYFLYVGVIDPNGGVNILWPLFGISNQMLAAIALSIATGIIIKSRKPRYALVTLVPLAWLALVTTTAAFQKITSPDARIGLLAAANELAAKLAIRCSAAGEGRRRPAPDLQPAPGCSPCHALHRDPVAGDLRHGAHLRAAAARAAGAAKFRDSLPGAWCAQCRRRGGAVRTAARVFAGSAAVRAGRQAWRWLRELSGDDAYERYRHHHAVLHPGEPPLCRRAHYEQAQRHKWSGVSRCC